MDREGESCLDVPGMRRSGHESAGGLRGLAVAVMLGATDSAALGDIAADSPALKEKADRMAFTVEQLVQILDRVDLFLAGPALHGYAPNIQAALTIAR